MVDIPDHLLIRTAESRAKALGITAVSYTHLRAHET